MQVKSKGSILYYFRSSLSYHLSSKSLFCLFLSGRLRQVLLYFFCNDDNEPHLVKTLLLGCEPGETQISLFSSKGTQEYWNDEFSMYKCFVIETTDDRSLDFMFKILIEQATRGIFL